MPPASQRRSEKKSIATMKMQAKSMRNVAVSTRSFRPRTQKDPPKRAFLLCGAFEARSLSENLGVRRLPEKAEVLVLVGAGDRAHEADAKTGNVFAQ
jgi:hypothetical protein